MLDEYRHSYEECADIIKEWRNKSVTDLCNSYITCDDPNLTEGYLSAIICKYWNVISRSYYAQKFIIASPEDVYEWVLEGILNALNRRPWIDPSNSLYQDEEGPDKAIKVCIYSAKINFFNANNYDKRSIIKHSLSLDELIENTSDDYYLPCFDKSPFIEMYMYEKVRKMFNEYDYFSAFLLDSIVSVDVFSDISHQRFYELSHRKLIKHLRHLSDRYCKIFSDTYGLDFIEVKKAAEFISNLDSNRMNRNIINLLFLLRQDKELVDYIKGQ